MLSVVTHGVQIVSNNVRMHLHFFQVAFPPPHYATYRICFMFQTVVIVGANTLQIRNIEKNILREDSLNRLNIL